MEQNIFIPHWPFLLDDENRPIQQQRIVHNERFLIQGECKKLLSTHSFFSWVSDLGGLYYIYGEKIGVI